MRQISPLLSFPDMKWLYFNYSTDSFSLLSFYILFVRSFFLNSIVSKYLLLLLSTIFLLYLNSSGVDVRLLSFFLLVLSLDGVVIQRLLVIAHVGCALDIGHAISTRSTFSLLTAPEYTYSLASAVSTRRHLAYLPFVFQVGSPIVIKRFFL